MSIASKIMSLKLRNIVNIQHKSRYLCVEYDVREVCTIKCFVGP